MNCFSPSELEGTPGGALWSFKSWAVNSSITERFPLLNASSRTRRLLAFRSAMALPPEQLRPTKTGSHSTPGRPDLNPQLTRVVKWWIVKHFTMEFSQIQGDCRFNGSLATDRAGPLYDSRVREGGAAPPPRHP